MQDSRGVLEGAFGNGRPGQVRLELHRPSGPPRCWRRGIWQIVFRPPKSVARTTAFTCRCGLQSVGDQYLHNWCGYGQATAVLNLFVPSTSPLRTSCAELVIEQMLVLSSHPGLHLRAVEGLNSLLLLKASICVGFIHRSPNLQ